MKLLDEYIIPFHGLKEEIREFNFEVKSEFFEFYQNPDYHGGALKISIMVSKKTNFVELHFSITGRITVTCDRCLEDISYPVAVNDILIVKLGNEYEELDENTIVIPKEETRINVAQYIYEFAVLSLPVRRIHSETWDGQECNPDMIKLLEEYRENMESTDPRWDNLKKYRPNK